MKNTTVKKVFSLLIVFALLLQQLGFAQDLEQLDISKYINKLSISPGPHNFRPLLLRYFSYQPHTDNFQLLLDKGSQKKIEDGQIRAQGQELLKYFLVGVTLADQDFWVNLRPDKEDQIIDRELSRTDFGKVLLEADLQLKKDTARFTSPETPTGREYWDKLYKKAGELFGQENITIPTLTRPWIVPGEVIIRETADSAYIYKATLKVMLEQDHLKNSALYNFSDPRLKELNEYSSKLIRGKIIPQLTREVNSSAQYASLRQVFYSLILARWFKSRFSGKAGLYSGLINSANLSGLTSKTAWSKTTYFKAYQKSFASGEYNINEQVTTAFGPVIRAYFSGGVALGNELTIPTPAQPQSGASTSGTFVGKSAGVTEALKKNAVPLTGTASSAAIVPVLTESRAFGYGGTPVERAILEAGTAHFNVSAAAAAGRFFEIYGHNRKDLGILATGYVQKSGIKINAAAENEKVSKRLKVVQGLLEATLDDATLKNIVQAIKDIPEAEVDPKAKDFYRLVKGLDLTNISEARRVLVNDTRIVCILAKEGTLEEKAQALAAEADITSPAHKAIVSFGGRAQYAGSQGVQGGPRSIYFDLARLGNFVKPAKDGTIALQFRDELVLWFIHEYKDLARGYHKDEFPEVMARLTHVHRGFNDAGVRESAAAEKKKAEKANPVTVSIFGAEIGKFLGNSKVVPQQVSEAMRARLDRAVEEKLIEDYYLLRVASRVNLFILQRKGEESPYVHALIQNAFEDAIRKAQQQGLYRYQRDILQGGSSNTRAKEICLSFGETTIDLQLGETLGFIVTNSGGIGATDILLWSAWSDPRRSDAIPNVAVSRPGFVYELQDIEDGTTHYVHSYDQPHLTALLKEGRHVAKRIWALKRDAKGNPIPLKQKNYTYEELEPYLDEPVAFTVTETVGYDSHQQPGSFNAITLARLQTWKGPDSGELNSALFTTSPVVLQNNGALAPLIPVSLERLAELPQEGQVFVSIVGFEPLPVGKFADRKGRPTQVGDPLANYQFVQQAEEGRFLAALMQRHPASWEGRMAFGARQKELEAALAAVPAYPVVEADPKHPGARPDYRPAYRRNQPKSELPNPVTIVVGKCDKGGKFGHDEVPQLFAEREKELVEDAYRNSAGKVNRELIAAALADVLSDHYDSLARAGTLGENEAKGFKEKTKALLSNAQGMMDLKTKEVVFQTELANVGKALLTREDVSMLLQKVVSKVYALDFSILSALLEKAYADPRVYVWKNGDILAWRHWREAGDDAGFVLVLSGLRRYAPAVHSLYKDIEWEVVYSEGRKLGVYGLAQDLSEIGVTGNTKGSGIGMSIVETDAAIAKEGLVLNLNDKSNAGAFSLPLLEYLAQYSDPVLVQVLDPFKNEVRYYNSKTQFVQLQEVLGRHDKYSIQDIWALPDTELARKYPFLLDWSLGELSSEKLFLIFGRYKGKDDAALVMLKAFLNALTYSKSFKKPWIVVGNNRGLNMNWLRPIHSSQPQAVAHDGSSLALMLEIGSFDNINPETGEIQNVRYTFDGSEFNQARELAVHANRLSYDGTSPFEGGPGGKVSRDTAEYNMAKPVEDDLAALGLTVPTVRQTFNPGSPVNPDAGNPPSAPAPSAGPAQDGLTVPVGGIDWTVVIPQITQPMGNLSGLNFSLPKLSNIADINLSRELDSLQKMLKAGITPSADRFIEYVTTCYQKGEFRQHLDAIVGILVDICRLEEEKVDEAPIALKKVMLILDAAN